MLWRTRGSLLLAIGRDIEDRNEELMTEFLTISGRTINETDQVLVEGICKVYTTTTPRGHMSD